MKSALLLIVVCGMLLWGCGVLQDVFSETTDVGQSDAPAAAITAPTPSPIVETPEEFVEKMIPAARQAAKTIIDAAASTGWGQTAQTVAVALGGLITTGAGIYWTIKRRKKTKRDKQASDTIVKAIEDVRQATPSVKFTLSNAITRALENTGLTRKEYNAYVAEKKSPKMPPGTQDG